MVRVIIACLLLVIFGCSHDDNQIVDGDDNITLVLQFPDDPLINNIRSYRLTVTALDIVDPAMQTSNISPQAGIADTITVYAPEGNDRTFTIYFRDENDGYIFSGRGSSNVSDTDSLISLSILQTGAQSATRVKILRDNLPWDSDALDMVLSDIGLTLGTEEGQYQVIASDEFDSVSLSAGEDLVIIANDQSQEFYNNYSASQPKIEAFINNGGTIFWEACDLGWARGSIDQSGLDLPGGVEFVSGYEDTNYVASSLYVITSGLDSVLTGNYASHEGFIDLPDGAVVYTRDSRNLPTLVSFAEGNGWVIISGQPLEYNYQPGNASTPGALLPRIIRHVLGYEL